MTTKQKVVLIVLAILDVAVVTGLGAIMVSRSRPSADPAPILPAEDPCAEALLSALATTGDATTVAWTREAAHLSVAQSTVVSTVPAEQYLWTVLDSLPAPLPVVCPLPETVTISVHAPEGTVHTTRLNGSDLAAWLAGTQSDQDLAARALYRSLPSQPLP